MNIKDNLIVCKDDQRIWVIGDTHGCYDQFMEIINSTQIAEEDIIILVGDIIDTLAEMYAYAERGDL